MKKFRQELLATLPSFGWLAFFLLAPTLLVLAIAFRETEPAGGIGAGWTLGQFGVFTQKSILFCLALALPVAWFLARVRKELRPRLPARKA